MKNLFKAIPFMFLFGCASIDRGCSSTVATTFGADWVVVQYRADGAPMNCWKLKNASIVNETGSDGVYWLDDKTGHLVHISGWYNRVQVSNGNFDNAAKLVGVESNLCKNGKYFPPKDETVNEQIITQ